MDMRSKHFIETPELLPKRKREMEEIHQLDQFPLALNTELKVK